MGTGRYWSEGEVSCSWGGVMNYGGGEEEVDMVIKNDDDTRSRSKTVRAEYCEMLHEWLEW